MTELDTRSGGQFRKSHVAGAACCSCAPLFEESSVAEGHERSGVEAEARGDGVDPFFRAFQFGKVADGGFIEDAMAISVGVFGPPFFINKDRLIAELAENYSESIAIGDCGFGFETAFVARGGIVVGGHAFVGKQPAVSVSPDSENGVAGAKVAVGRVVERVALESAGRDDAKAEGAEMLLKVGNVLDTKLDFGFNGAHGACIGHGASISAAGQ